MRSGGESELNSRCNGWIMSCSETEDRGNCIRYDARKNVRTRYRTTCCSERRHKTANAISVSAPPALKMTSCISFCGLSQVSIISTIGPDKYEPSHRKISPFKTNCFITIAYIFITNIISSFFGHESLVHGSNRSHAKYQLKRVHIIRHDRLFETRSLTCRRLSLTDLRALPTPYLEHRTQQRPAGWRCP